MPNVPQLVITERLSFQRPRFTLAAVHPRRMREDASTHKGIQECDFERRS